jgi:hypothetical protein
LRVAPIVHFSRNSTRRVGCSEWHAFRIGHVFLKEASVMEVNKLGIKAINGAEPGIGTTQCAVAQIFNFGSQPQAGSFGRGATCSVAGTKPCPSENALH